MVHQFCEQKNFYTFSLIILQLVLVYENFAKQLFKLIIQFFRVHFLNHQVTLIVIKVVVNFINIKIKLYLVLIFMILIDLIFYPIIQFWLIEIHWLILTNVIKLKFFIKLFIIINMDQMLNLFMKQNLNDLNELIHFFF